jgi:hypothetical protein
MPAKYVRPYSKGQKNDFRDAEAIAEAVQRPTMKFVATKTADHDLQAAERLALSTAGGRREASNLVSGYLPIACAEDRIHFVALSQTSAGKESSYVIAFSSSAVLCSARPFFVRPCIVDRAARRSGQGRPSR